jgi:hypothetical protein
MALVGVPDIFGRALVGVLSASTSVPVGGVRLGRSVSNPCLVLDGVAPAFYTRGG